MSSRRRTASLNPSARRYLETQRRLILGATEAAIAVIALVTVRPSRQIPPRTNGTQIDKQPGRARIIVGSRIHRVAA